MRKPALVSLVLILAGSLAAQQRTVSLTLEALPSPERLEDLKQLQAIITVQPRLRCQAVVTTQLPKARR